MLIVDNAAVSELLTMADCIRVQDEAFRKLPSGASIHRPRIDMYFPCDRPDGYFRWGTMEGANDGFFAIRMKSDICTWPVDANGNVTEEKYCVEPGTYCGLILLISTKNGEPLAFINDGVLQQMRVGGGAGLGAKYLSREDSHIVGMIGSGGMARRYLEAFSCVRPIAQCNVYSPNAAHREAFAHEMSGKLGIEVRAVGSAREAIKGADILSSCTDGMAPVYDADWLEKGMHVTDLNQHEVPSEAFERFDVTVRQGQSGLALVESDRIQSGIGQSPVAVIGGTSEAMKRLPKKPDARASSLQTRFAMGSAIADFTDIVGGTKPGRTSRDQITFYRNGGNQGLQFSCVGGWVYTLARDRKLGREIPTEWFLQDVRD
jgi:alanine dehydrogenase